MLRSLQEIKNRVCVLFFIFRQEVAAQLSRFLEFSRFNIKTLKASQRKDVSLT